MAYRVLVDLEAIEFLDALPDGTRQRLLAHFGKLGSTPDRYSDYQEYDRTGRQVEVNVFAGHSIHYWIDFADRHVKILSIRKADR
jgi:hypothetical protein